MIPLKKSALDFAKNRRVKRILSVLLFGICIAYVIVSSIGIFDWYYAHGNLPSDYFTNDGVSIVYPVITFKECLAAIFRISLKCTGAFAYGNALYLWAWSNFRNGEQKSDIAICILLGTFAFCVSWIWSVCVIVCYHLFCPVIFAYSAYEFLLTFKSDDYMPKTKPVLGMLISAGIWILLKMIL